MGIWSLKDPFGNDEAMDWVGDLIEHPVSEWREFFNSTFANFAGFEARRAKGLNRYVRTAERAEHLINLASPPLSGDLAAMIRRGIGKEYEDPGANEANQLLAASVVLVAAITGDKRTLPAELATASFASLEPIDSLAQRAIELLRKIPRNRMLCRDYGPSWKQRVLKLSDKLAMALGESGA